MAENTETETGPTVAAEYTDREQRVIDMGGWDPACQYCRKAGRPGGFFPSHKASPRCESGKRAHCSCSTCF